MGAASECRDAPSRRFYTHRRGPVAQSVEQGTFNPKVAGSIPARPIRNKLENSEFSHLEGAISVGRGEAAGTRRGFDVAASKIAKDT